MKKIKKEFKKIEKEEKNYQKEKIASFFFFSILKRKPKEKSKRIEISKKFHRRKKKVLLFNSINIPSFFPHFTGNKEEICGVLKIIKFEGKRSFGKFCEF